MGRHRVSYIIAALFFIIAAAHNITAAQPVTSPKIEQAKRAVANARSDSERAEALMTLSAEEVNLADFSGAQASLEQCVRIFRPLEAEEASSEASQVILVRCLGMLGFVLRRQNSKEAISNYQEQLRIVRQAVAKNPQSQQWQGLLLATLQDVSRTFADGGDYEQAKPPAAEAVAVARRIESTSSERGQAQFDLQECLGKQAEILAALGDVAGAQKGYEESLTIIEALSAANPNSGEIHHDYVITLVRLGDLTRDNRRYQKAIEVARSMQRRGILSPEDADMIDDISERLKAHQ
jgi:tetratricopeptide (TPR) repeat protein